MTTTPARFSRRTALAGLMAAGAALALPAAPARAHGVGAGGAGDGIAAVLRAGINDNRRAHGLPPLLEDGHLSAVSAAWSAHMAGGAGLSHNHQRDAQYGWPLSESGEIVGYARNPGMDAGQLAAQIVQSWMASAPHRAIILGAGWSDLGVGWAVDGSGRLWATANTITAPLPSPGAEALSLSAAFLPDASAPRLVLVRADQHPDALSAVGLAGPDSPLLLVRPDQPLPGEVVQEIRRVAAPGAIAYLVGGALAPQVDQQVAEAGVAVVRVAGEDRYATAAAVAREIVAARGVPQGVLLARGDQWPDAVAVGGLAARYGHAVLLVDGDEVPAATDEVRRELSASWAVAIGGDGAIAQHVVDRLGATRLSGHDRAETGAGVMRHLWLREHATAGDHLVVTPGWTGDGWATALAHTTWSARFEAPVLYASPIGVPDPVRATLQQTGYSSATPAVLQFARCVPEDIRTQFRAIAGS